jgi:hypothetical protein
MTTYSWIKPLNWEQAFDYITKHNGEEIKVKFKGVHFPLIIAWGRGKERFKEVWMMSKYSCR